LSHMPKALMKLTEKQIQRFKNKMPKGGDAPMMSPNDLFAFLSKKEPKPEEEVKIKYLLEPEEMKKGAFDKMLDIMKKDPPKPQEGGLHSRIKSVIQPNRIPSNLSSLDDLRRTRQITKREPSILDRL
jgi:hypothetical protein